MTNFVMGLLAVQLLMGAFLFTFAIPGNPQNTARATRLPSLVLFFHPVLGVAATAIWLVWMMTGERGWAWASFVVLLLTVGGGAHLTHKTYSGPSVLERPDVTDPADVRLVERQMPMVAVVAHGVIAAALLLCTLLVGLGVTG